MSNNNENEFNKNNKNPEQEVIECSTNSDINDDNQNYSRKQLKKTYVCNVNDCGKEYRIKYSYTRHSTRRHSDKTMRCNHLGCDYVTRDEGYLKSHLIQHRDERPFTCSIEECGKTFKRKSDRRIHQISHKSSVIQCTRQGCDGTFKAEIYLKRHINHKHSSVPKSYVCIACGKYYDTMGKRQHHQRVVHRKIDRPIICRIDKCKRKFTNHYGYTKHKQICHSGQEFRCDHSGCDYVTNKRNLISCHVKKHLESRPFVCGIDGCVKAFKLKRYLKNHRETHSSERFACDAFGCKKIFKTEQHLNRHMKIIHSTEYKCSSVGCEEAFKSHCLYKAHLRQIHNKGSLSCAHLDCHYTTDHKGNLKSHLKTHSDERSFLCDTDGCGKAYKRENALKRHRLTHIETLDKNFDPNINEENKLLTPNFDNCTKPSLTDLNRQTETERYRSQSLESELNPSIPLSITDSNDTIECNANTFIEQSRTQIVLCEDSDETS